MGSGIEAALKQIEDKIDRLNRVLVRSPERELIADILTDMLVEIRRLHLHTKDSRSVVGDLMCLLNSDDLGEGRQYNQQTRG